MALIAPAYTIYFGGMASLLIIFSIFMCFSAGGFADSESEIRSYYEAALPNTPMPDIINELLIHTAAKGPASVGAGIPRFTSYKFPGYQSRKKLSAGDLQEVFFLKKDMHPGAEMKQGIFVRTITAVTFLPRAKADNLPFSSTQVTQILDRLSVAPGSEVAKGVENTLSDCEAPAARGETKYCATSLESMIDFATSELGTRDLNVVATTVHGKPENQNTTYNVSSEGTKLPGDKLVACHPEPYPYTVFYCHMLQGTRAYVVPLIGKDGSMVSAVTVCHSDTSNWNPIFFKVFKVKPGTEPICHFLPLDHLLWSPSH